MQQDLEKYSKTLQQVISKLKADAGDTFKTKRKKPDFVDGKLSFLQGNLCKFHPKKLLNDKYQKFTGFGVQNL